MKHTRKSIRALAVVLAAALLLGGFAATASAALPSNMTQAQKDFIATVGAMAAADMKKSDILASLTLAQAILESGWGTSTLATQANALFGIKADSRWSGRVFSKQTQECYDGVNFVTETALFRAYDSWQDSVNDHSAFLIAGSRYAAVIGEKDYKKACNAIHKAGYATDPGYASKLISLIERYELTAFDTLADNPDEPGNPGTPGNPDNPSGPSGEAIRALLTRLLAAIWQAVMKCPPIQLLFNLT